MGPSLRFDGLGVGWSLTLLATMAPGCRAPRVRPPPPQAGVYGSGFSVFTLGVGRVDPATGPWALATIVAAASGLRR